MSGSGCFQYHKFQPFPYVSVHSYDQEIWYFPLKYSQELSFIEKSELIIFISFLIIAAAAAQVSRIRKLEQVVQSFYFFQWPILGSVQSQVGALWDSGRCPCPTRDGTGSSWRSFFNPNHSISLWKKMLCRKKNQLLPIFILFYYQLLLIFIFI